MVVKFCWRVIEVVEEWPLSIVIIIIFTRVLCVGHLPHLRVTIHFIFLKEEWAVTIDFFTSETLLSIHHRVLIFVFLIALVLHANIIRTPDALDLLRRRTHAVIAKLSIQIAFPLNWLLLEILESNDGSFFIFLCHLFFSFLTPLRFIYGLAAHTRKELLFRDVALCGKYSPVDLITSKFHQELIHQAVVIFCQLKEFLDLLDEDALGLSVVCQGPERHLQVLLTVLHFRAERSSQILWVDYVVGVRTGRGVEVLDPVEQLVGLDGLWDIPRMALDLVFVEGTPELLAGYFAIVRLIQHFE